MSANCFQVPSVNNNNNNNDYYYSAKEENHNPFPIGDLFDDATDVDGLISKSASIRRTFGPSSNAEAMLTLGGPSLAANASFDPHYHRAREWIHHHAVGPTVQSPVLIQGLIGALVEAAFPSSIIISNSMQNIRPLIVGLEVEASITVESIQKNKNEEKDTQKEEFDTTSFRLNNSRGYEVLLLTKVTRVHDGEIIAKGTHTIWIADHGL